MAVFLTRRLLQGLLVVAVMSLLVFTGMFVLGHPADLLLPPDMDLAEKARIIHQKCWDCPLSVQYLDFVKRALHGDLGTSFVHGIPAVGLILERLPATLELATVAMMLAVLLGIPLGLWAGLKPNSFIGRSIMASSIIGFSLPTFWVALMMIMLFSVQLGWLPSNGRGDTVDVWGVPLSILTLDGWRHLLMPALNLALFNISMVIRLTSSGAREALLQDYVKFARAKGLSHGRVIGVHVLRNILIPIVTVVGLQFGSLIAFTVVTESIFSWPGIGKLLIDSMNLLDRPVVVAYLLIVVTMFIVINAIVDILYSVLDPRVRLADTDR